MCFCYVIFLFNKGLSKEQALTEATGQARIPTHHLLKSRSKRSTQAIRYPSLSDDEELARTPSSTKRNQIVKGLIESPSDDEFDHEPSSSSDADESEHYIESSTSTTPLLAPDFVAPVVTSSCGGCCCCCCSFLLAPFLTTGGQLLFLMIWLLF
jgi:hypothetical protein